MPDLGTACDVNTGCADSRNHICDPDSQECRKLTYICMMSLQYRKLTYIYIMSLQCCKLTYIYFMSLYVVYWTMFTPPQRGLYFRCSLSLWLSLCLSLCMCVCARPNKWTDLDAVFAKWLLTTLAQIFFLIWWPCVKDQGYSDVILLFSSS